MNEYPNIEQILKPLTQGLIQESKLWSLVSDGFLVGVFPSPTQVAELLILLAVLVGLLVASLRFITMFFRNLIQLISDFKNIRIICPLSG